MSLKIESIIRRPGGTKGVIMGTTSYDFLPNAEGAHVANVLDPDHAQKFLKISEGYRIYTSQEPGDAETGAGAIGAIAASASTQSQEPNPTPPAKQAPAAGAAKQQVDSTNAPATEPTKPSGEANDTKDPATPAPTGKTVALEDMDPDKLREVFQDEVGRKPHPQAKDETLIAQIKAKRLEAPGSN